MSSGITSKLRKGLEALVLASAVSFGSNAIDAGNAYSQESVPPASSVRTVKDAEAQKDSKGTKLTYKRKYNTFGHWILDTEREAFKDFKDNEIVKQADLIPTDNEYKILDNIIDDVRINVKPIKNFYNKDEVKKAMEEIATVLEKKGFNGNRLTHFGQSLREKNYYCIIGSLIFSSVADALGYYPLKIIVVGPEHIALTWDPGNDGNDIFNPKSPLNKGDLFFDSTGLFGTPQEYMEKFKKTMSIEGVKKGHYLKGLTAEKKRGFIYSGVGYTLDNDAGLKLIQKATELNPEDPENYARKSHHLLISKKNYDEALKAAEKAISMNDQWYRYYFFKGWALQEKGDKKGAEQCYRKAIELESNDGLSKERLAELGVQIGLLK